MPKHIVVDKLGSTELKDMEMPVAGVGELVIKIVASGLCHTDVHMIDGDWPIQPTVTVPGHEGVGIVVQVGNDVTGFALKDRVGVAWLAQACGECEMCEKGHENFCSHQKNNGYSVPGAFADFMKVNSKFCVHIPPELSNIQAAPILCAGLTSYTALKTSKIGAGEWVLITGAAGGLGHLAVQYAKAFGVRVVAVDRGSDKVSFCDSLGADITVDSDELSEKEFLKVIHDKTGGVHAAIALAPCLKSMELAVQTLRPTGTLVLVGLPPGYISISPFDIIMKGLHIVGSLVGTRADLKAALEIAARGEIVCRTHVEPMSNQKEAIRKLRASQYEGRVVFADTPEFIA